MSLIPNHTTESTDAKASKLVCWLFMITLCVPAMLGFLSLTEDSNVLKSEKRNKREWPERALMQHDFTAYSAGVNDYLADRVGLRASFLKLYAIARYRLLNLGVSSKAAIGRNGWLYYSDNRVLEHAQGLRPMSEQAAQQWLVPISEAKARIEAYGGHFVVLLVPEKDQVYPEYLPSRIVYRRQGRRADTLVSVADEMGLNLINLLDPMLEAKKEGRLYFKSDSHWTQRGAFVAYQALINDLFEKGVQVPFEPWESLELDEPRRISGDLASLLNLSSEFEEEAEIHTPVHLQKGYEANATDKPSLLLVGDSFAARLQDFLPASFNKPAFVHHHFKAIPLARIEKHQPDVVVLEIIEQAR